MKMRRRQKLCETCIFRPPISEADRAALTRLPPDHVPCHTDCPMGGDVQCRGHFEAQRKARGTLLANHGAPPHD